MVIDAEKSLVNHNKTEVINQKSLQNGTSHKKEALVDPFLPPDGGTKAWLVLIGSFFCNGIVFGVINSYSVLYAQFHDNFEKKGYANPSSSAGEF